MSNDENKPECEHSSSESEPECGFSVRLKEAIGGRSVLSFAKECGLSDSLVRKYLSGSLPGLDKAIVMAKVAGVSLEWLATGEGAGEKGDTSQPQPLAALDLETLERVLGMVRKAEDAHQVRLSSAAAARVVRMLYDWVQNNQVPLTQKMADDVVEAQAGHDLWKG